MSDVPMDELPLDEGQRRHMLPLATAGLKAAREAMGKPEQMEHDGLGAWRMRVWLKLTAHWLSGAETDLCGRALDPAMMAAKAAILEASRSFTEAEAAIATRYPGRHTEVCWGLRARIVDVAVDGRVLTDAELEELRSTGLPVAPPEARLARP